MRLAGFNSGIVGNSQLINTITLSTAYNFVVTMCYSDHSHSQSMMQELFHAFVHV